MELMNQVLTVVQSAAIPLLAVLMAIVVINMMKGTGKTTAVKEDSFKVTESGFWLVIALFGVAAAAVFVWLASTNKTEGQVVTAYVLAVICVIVSVITCYVYFKRSPDGGRRHPHLSAVKRQSRNLSGKGGGQN